MRYTASRYADLADTRFGFGSKVTQDMLQIYYYETVTSCYAFFCDDLALPINQLKLHSFHTKLVFFCSQEPCNSRTYCRNTTEIKPDCDVLLTNAIKLLILLSHMSILYSLTYVISTNAVPTYAIFRLFPYKWRNSR